MNTEHPTPTPPPLGPPASGEPLPTPDPHPHLSVSALADGDAAALSAGCALWRDDPLARERWHLYHLIGDVLRSDELSSTPGRDRAFVAGVRERLAREPVPLAPSNLSAPATSARTTMAAPSLTHPRRLGWRAPAAVAAGFVAVAGVLVLTQGGGRTEPTMAAQVGAAPVRVAADAPPPRVAAAPAPDVASALPPLAAPRLVRSGDLLRDPGLDAYLRAHQAARGGVPVALPGGGLRSAELIVLPALPALPVVQGPLAVPPPPVAAEGTRK